MEDRGGKTLVRGENAKARAAGSPVARARDYRKGGAAVGAAAAWEGPWRAGVNGAGREEPPRLRAPLRVPPFSIPLLPYLPFKNSVLTIYA